MLLAKGSFLESGRSPGHGDGSWATQQMPVTGYSELQIWRKCEEAAQLLAEDFQGTGGPLESKSDFLSACKTGGLDHSAHQDPKRGAAACGARG
jgi:hypothetical protein